jgi:ribose 5-phosphate isomerase A
MTDDKKIRKEIAAKRAVELIDDGMVIGIGSGTTVEIFIRELGKRIIEEGMEVWGVPSSYHSHILAVQSGINVTDLFQFSELDICIDGADQIDSDFNCIKGMGGALLREKIIAQASEKVIIIADSEKFSEKLSIPVPMEVVPFAYGNVMKKLEKHGVDVKVRSDGGKLGPCISDNGNFILDADLGVIDHPEETEIWINSIAGVVDNGIFSNRLIDGVVVGYSDSAKFIKNDKKQRR